jgi:DNA-binding response OmpR family regulator
MASSVILVVDDDATIRDVVAETLTQEGYATTTAADGEEALALLTRDEPGLVLLDLRLPRVDGWEVARQMRARGLSTPVVVMTAELSVADYVGELGAAGLLVKPFNLVELLNEVARVCGPPAAA